MLRRALLLFMVMLTVPNLASAYNVWTTTRSTSPSTLVATAITPPANQAAPGYTTSGNYTYATSTSSSTAATAPTTMDYTVNAAPAGYTLAYVMIDGVKYTAPNNGAFYRVSKGAKINHTISAVYATAKYTITTSKSGNGYIDPTAQVAAGASKTINITPGYGAQIADVLVDGGSVGTPSSYTFTNVQAPHTIAATFTTIPTVDAVISTLPQTIAVGSSLTIDGSASTSSVTPTWTWTTTGGTVTPVTVDNPATYVDERKTATFSAADAGTYTVTLTLDNGATDSASVVITVASQAVIDSNQCTSCHNDRNAALVAAWNAGTHGTTAASCQACHSGTHGTVPVLADNYVGSATCGACHTDKYATFARSGHNFKMSKVVNGQVPTFPFSNISGALQAMPAVTTGNALGKPTSYDQVSYVVGGYGWKARWFDLNGYLVTSNGSGGVQYNLANGSWSNYAGTNKKYDCGECHTTGWKYSTTEHQDNLPGMYGTWVQSGVQCEACHGAGKVHALAPSAANIAKLATSRTTAQLQVEEGYGLAITCGECHTRDGERNVFNRYSSNYNKARGILNEIGGRIVAAGGLGNHHQSYDELLGVDSDNISAGGLGKHLKAGMSCGTCHNPHKTTKYQGVSNDGLGVDVDCTSCHAVTFTATGSAHANEACITCHMPKLTKSATSSTNAAGKTIGDIKTHLFKIDLSKTAQFNTAGNFMKPWVTPDYACGTCHATTADKVTSLTNNFGGRIHATVAYAHPNNNIQPTGNSCLICHTGNGTEAKAKVSLPTESTPAATTPIIAGEYVGTSACRSCHADQFTTFVKSGHPFKMSKVVDGQVPSFPFSDLDPTNNGVGVLALMPAASTGNVLGKPTSYDQVSYIVGGYGWKARWFDLNGYLVTSNGTGGVQYNLANGSWSNYAGTNKKYDCGECHTTGWVYDADGNGQDNLPGMYGTWQMPGVQCEACHGAAADHAATGDAAVITRVAAARTEAQLLADEGYGLPVHCGECHTRDGERNSYGGSGSGSTANGDAYKSAYNKASGTTDTIGGRIVAAGGLGNHHQSYDELKGVLPADYDVYGTGTITSLTPVGKHLPAGVSCNSCHNPHKTTKYQGVTGDPAVVDCTSCHAAKASFTVAAHVGLDCVNCHMPKLTKSATGGTNAAGKTIGDIKTHLFKINLSAANQFNTAGTFMYPFATKDYACGSCHAVPADKVNSLNSTYGGKIHP